MSSRDNKSEEEKALEEEFTKALEGFLKREDSLKKEHSDVENRLKTLKVEILKWLGKKIQSFLEEKKFLDVIIGYVCGHPTSGGINPDTSTYRDFSEIGKSFIFPIDDNCRCLWLRIEFGNPMGLLKLHLNPIRIVLFKRIEENEINPEAVSSMFNEFSRDISFLLK